MSDNEFTILSFNDGAALLDLNEAIKKAAIDLRDREEVAKPRKVVFELVLTPQDGGFIKISARSKVSLPPNEPRKTLCSLPDDAGKMRDLNFDGVRQGILPL